MPFAAIGNIRNFAARVAVPVPAFAQLGSRGNARTPIFLGLEFERAQEVVEEDYLFILRSLFFRKLPRRTFRCQFLDPF